MWALEILGAIDMQEFEMSDDECKAVVILKRELLANQDWMRVEDALPVVPDGSVGSGVES